MSPLFRKVAQAAWLSCALIVCCRQAPAPAKVVNDYPLKPVDFTAVKLEDEFWAPRLEVSRTVTIPYLFRANEETGRVDNFRIAAGLKKGKHTGKRYNDSDVFKAMEAAAYSLRAHPDPVLREKLDELVAVIGKAQEPDGYLFTTRTIDPENPAPGAGKERWSNLRVSHELYNVGHMYEAAVAHYAATGERTFLDIAVKNADLLVRTFGPGKRRAFPGHQEIEIGLGKLYRVTGNAQYLELARFFLDERGRYYGGEPYPSDSPFVIYNSEEYLQNHRPVVEQTEAVGHAVRATYMYSGMADVAALAGRPEYASAAGVIWENVIGKKLYLTGGIGSSGEYEAFGPEYELPNARAYAETCASVGNALWSQRMFQLYGDAQYVDILERIVYNGLISGVSLGGDRFFYQNPLESAGRYERSAWFEVACCPANVARFLPTLPGYVYAVGKNTLYINLYAAGAARFDVDGRPIEITQETKYPWEGRVRILVNPRPPRKFTAMLRIPGWALNKPVPDGLYRFLDKDEQPVRLWINRKPVEFEIEKGYIRLSRKWRSNDLVELILPMSSRRVVADERVSDNVGRAALQRGPVVFCAEGVDNGGRVLNLVLPDDAKVEYWQRRDLLGGVAILTAKAEAVEKDAEGKIVSRTPHDLMAVPYFAWANRGPGEMAVWLPRTESAVRPKSKN
jgi:hypothetical protein